jgi:hypothetical protein
MKAILWGSMPCDLVSICAGNYLPAIVFSHVFRHKIRRTDFQILKRGLATCSPARFEAIMSTADKKRARSQPKDQNRKVGIHSDIVDVSQFELPGSVTKLWCVGYPIGSRAVERARFCLQ